MVSMMASQAKAQLSCVDRDNLHETGYLISKNQVRHLVDDAFLSRNKRKSTFDKVKGVEANIRTIWKNSEVKGFKLNSMQLAELIVRVSERTGVDYQILAAILRKESGYCMFRLNKRGGDSGCMQFTTPALTELQHQFGFEGASKHAPGIPDVLKVLVERFFKTGAELTGAETQQMNRYTAWLKQDIDKIKRSLRSGQLAEFDVLSGAIFLKVKLAIANGNYGVAVRNYNGSKQKFAYQSSVMGNAMKISENRSSFEEQLCIERHEFEYEIRKMACDLTEDPDRCFQSFLATLPNYT